MTAEQFKENDGVVAVEEAEINNIRWAFVTTDDGKVSAHHWDGNEFGYRQSGEIYDSLEQAKSYANLCERPRCSFHVMEI